MIKFDIYDRQGAYHWSQSDPQHSDYNPPLVARYHVLANQVPVGPGKVLDIGCGDGYTCYLLLRRGINGVAGVDADSTGIQLGRQKLYEHGYTAVSLLIGSAYVLPFSDESYNTITMADVIEHLDDPYRALGETARVLCKNGTAVFSTPNRQPNRVWDKRHVQEFLPEKLLNLLNPFFSQIRILGCWPMPVFRAWESSKKVRRIINNLARRGLNLFEFTTPRPTRLYGQLIAVCRK